MKDDHLPIADLTVILNIWKRNYLEEQLRHLWQQSLRPAHIWILQCGEHIDVQQCLRQYPQVEYFHSSVDLKYFGRYSLAQHVKTRYTWVLDDDIIPSRTWVETCVKTCQYRRAIVCSNGRIIPARSYYPERVMSQSYREKYFIGDGMQGHAVNWCSQDTLVDYGCSSFFFQSDWIKHFWSLSPYTLDTGEDMHLSASCKIQAGIATVVPQQLSLEDSGNIQHSYSCDAFASWRHHDFLSQRAQILRYLLEEKQWKTLLTQTSGVRGQPTGQGDTS